MKVTMMIHYDNNDDEGFAVVYDYNNNNDDDDGFAVVYDYYNYNDDDGFAVGYDYYDDNDDDDDDNDFNPIIGVDISFDSTYKTSSFVISAKVVKKGGKWIRVGGIEWNHQVSDEEARE